MNEPSLPEELSREYQLKGITIPVELSEQRANDSFDDLVLCDCEEVESYTLTGAKIQEVVSLLDDGISALEESKLSILNAWQDETELLASKSDKPA